MSKKHFRSTSFGVFFLFIAIYDILAGTFMELEPVFKVKSGSSDFVCKFRPFMTALAQMGSGLTLSALSLDRCFAISWPLKAKVSSFLHTRD